MVINLEKWYFIFNFHKNNETYPEMKDNIYESLNIEHPKKLNENIQIIVCLKGSGRKRKRDENDILEHKEIIRRRIF